MENPEILPPEEMMDGSWSDWPRASFDDPRCQCDRLENHTFCPVHGRDDVTGWQRYLDSKEKQS